MILVWGSVSDSPVERVIEALSSRGSQFCHISESDLPTMRYDLSFGAVLSGWIEVRGHRIPIGDVHSLYIRPGTPPEGASQDAAKTLIGVASHLEGVVINRPAAGRANASKPYQLGLIARAGFRVPETLITTDPEAARAFLTKHRLLIYKSLSGIRSIVATVDQKDEARMEDVRSGPVQFQAYVPGLDVRVHVVGERWFACSVQSEAADYRYAGASGAPAELTAFDLPEPIAKKLVAMTRAMDLAVAGIDLRLTPDGSWVCFEVNPSPGFPWFEDATGHPIAEAIAELLES